jgi:hypothetical protein
MVATSGECCAAGRALLPAGGDAKLTVFRRLRPPLPSRLKRLSEAVAAIWAASCPAAAASRAGLAGADLGPCGRLTSPAARRSALLATVSGDDGSGLGTGGDRLLLRRKLAAASAGSPACCWLLGGPTPPGWVELAARSGWLQGKGMHFGEWLQLVQPSIVQGAPAAGSVQLQCAGRGRGRQGRLGQADLLLRASALGPLALLASADSGSRYQVAVNLWSNSFSCSGCIRRGGLTRELH